MNNAPPHAPRPVPLPAGLPSPLPRHLRWSEVIAIFAHWNVGGKSYLAKLVSVKVVTPLEVPHREHGRLYPTHEILACYPER